MAIFTPYTSTPPDPNYLGYSKTPEKLEGNKALGKLFDNAGDMIETGAKGLDDFDKRVIENQANEQFRTASQSEIERLEKTYRGISGGKGPPGMPLMGGMDAATEGDANNADDGPSKVKNDKGDTASYEEEPLPPAATAQLDYLKKVGEAGLAKKITSTGAQMNGEAILSDLLQRYPSRATMIRTIAGKYGFGEGRYQSVLRNEINQWQQQQIAKDNKDETWENANRDTLMAVDPNYFNRPKEERRAPDARDYYQTKIGNIEWVKKNTEIQKGLLDLKVAQAKEEEVKLDADRVWTDRRATDFGVKFEALTTQILGRPGVNNIDDFMTALKNNGKSLTDPKAREELGSRLEQFKQAFKAESIQLAAREKVGKEGGKQYTMLQLLKKEGIDGADSTVLTAIDSLQKWVDSKGAQNSFDAAGKDARVATAYTDASMLKILSTVPTAAAMKSWRDIIGEGVWGEQYKQSDSTLKQPVDKGMKLALDITTDNVGTGNPDPRSKKPETLGDTLYRYQHDWQINGKGGAVKPQDFAALLDRGHGMLMSSTMPIDSQIKFGKYLFSDKELLNQLNDSDKRKFLNKYTSPATTDRIYNLGDPELIEKYKGVVQNMVVATTQQTVSNIKAVTQRGNAPGTTGNAFDATPYYDLKFDPKTNKITGNFASNDQLYAEYGNNPTRYGSIKTQLDTVKKGVDQLNQVLTIYAPILQREKATISPEITTMFEQMGIKLPVEEGSNTHPLTGKPIINNADGSISTERTITAGFDGKYYNIPTIVNGKQVDNDTAISMYKSGLNKAVAGPFDSQSEAETVAKARSKHLGETSGRSNFAPEDLPSAGNIGDLDSFLANPTGSAKGKRKPKGNVSDDTINSISIDDIPEGMSARDFLKQLKDKRSFNRGTPTNVSDTGSGGGSEDDLDLSLDPKYTILDPVHEGQSYDDGPTNREKLKGPNTYKRLKNLEADMEAELAAPADTSKFEQNQRGEYPPGQPPVRDIADKQGKGSDLDGPYTPISPKALKDLLYDTPVASSKDPNYTRQDILDTLDWTQEEHNQRFKDIKKELGDRVIDQAPFPAGRIRIKENHPAAKELIKNLPDDIEVISVGDGTVIFRKKPSLPALTS